MSINAFILSRFVQGLAQRAAPRFESEEGRDTSGRPFLSAMLATMSAQAILRLPEEEALGCLLPEGAGIDAMRLGPVRDGAFAVHFFCGFADDPRHEALFPDEAVRRALRAAEWLLSPSSEPDLELTRLLLAGCVPHARFHFAGGQRPWGAMATSGMHMGQPGPIYEHYDADRLTHLIGGRERVTTSLRFSGRSAVDERRERSVVTGRMSVHDLARLVDAHGRELIERDISHFLDPDSVRAHESICRTLASEARRADFFIRNGGISLACDRLLGSPRAKDREFQAVNLRILDGRKTCRAVHDAIARRGEWAPNEASVKVRLCEASAEIGGGGLISEGKIQVPSFLPEN